MKTQNIVTAVLLSLSLAAPSTVLAQSLFINGVAQGAGSSAAGGAAAGGAAAGGAAAGGAAAGGAAAGGAAAGGAAAGGAAAGAAVVGGAVVGGTALAVGLGVVAIAGLGALVNNDSSSSTSGTN